MPMTFKKPTLMLFGVNKITDHNRSSLSIDTERIEKKQRMANGRMRKYVTADKKTFSCSWTMIPSTAAFTVDGGYGANDLETFWKTTKGEFVLTLTFTNPDLNAATKTYTETYTVMLSSFDKTLLKRGRMDFYDVSLTMEEV